MDGIILGVLQAYSIPPDFGQRLYTVYFWGYPLNIPYPRKTEKTYVPEFFWDIPGIFHIPKKLIKHMYQLFFWDIPGISHIPKIDKVGMYRFYFGIYQYPIFFLTYVPRVRKI